MATKWFEDRTPCRTCGHVRHLHGDGKNACVVRFPQKCDCKKFIRGTVKREEAS